MVWINLMFVVWRWTLDIGLWTYFPPVMSLALNFDGGGAGEPEKETYCIRKSANRPSSTCASCGSRLPCVFCSSMPRTSIQCFAVFRSTPVSPVTGCGISPKLAAAFDASDIIKLKKLAGSSRGSPPAAGWRSAREAGGVPGVACGDGEVEACSDAEVFDGAVACWVASTTGPF